MQIQERFVAAIREMREVDQDLRFMAKPGKEAANYMIYLADQVHSTRIRRLVDEFGYPTSQMVGKEVMKDFWLVVQHQDADPRLQEACLEKCDFEPQEHAYLMDRVLVNKGEPQMFGTQLQRGADGKTREPKPIRDADQVEARRKEVGLEPLSKYLEDANRIS